MSVIKLEFLAVYDWFLWPFDKLLQVLVACDKDVGSENPSGRVWEESGNQSPKDWGVSRNQAINLALGSAWDSSVGEATCLNLDGF